MKYSGRPVLYQMAEEAEGQKDVFTEIIDFDGSLKEAVATAKAAVLIRKGTATSYYQDIREAGFTILQKKFFSLQ